jgi:hypothetical protein
MEHNLVRYAKYYSYGSTKILGNNESTREIDHIRRDFKLQKQFVKFSPQLDSDFSLVAL